MPGFPEQQRGYCTVSLFYIERAGRPDFHRDTVDIGSYCSIRAGEANTRNGGDENDKRILRREYKQLFNRRFHRP